MVTSQADYCGHWSDADLERTMDHKIAVMTDLERQLRGLITEHDMIRAEMLDRFFKKAAKHAG